VVRINVTIEGGNVTLHIAAPVRNRRGLHAAVASAYAGLLVDHFRAKNSVPNKMGAPKTNFWNQVAAATQVAEVTEAGATVAVAEQRFRVHLYGGTIVPKKARMLTIPLIPAARGLMARSYEQKFGVRLFSIPGRRALFERTATAPTEMAFRPIAGRMRGTGRGGSRTVTETIIKARSGLRPVYALCPSVTIGADPSALPPPAKTAAILTEEARSYLTRELAKGGAA
jgi:hypothetical protein